MAVHREQQQRKNARSLRLQHLRERHAQQNVRQREHRSQQQVYASPVESTH
jgi:hypothetical protein